jgi:Flp pilus assembly pilin Flp
VDRSGGERGVTAVAYALMVAIIAVLLVGGVFVLGGSVQSAFNHGGDCLVSPSDCGDGSGPGSGGGNGGGNPGPTTSSRPGSTTTTTATTITAATGP